MLSKYTCPHCGSEDTKKTDTLGSFIKAVVAFCVLFHFVTKHHVDFTDYVFMLFCLVAGIVFVLTGLKSKGKNEYTCQRCNKTFVVEDEPQQKN